MKCNNGNYEISLYSGNLTPTVILQCSNKLKAAFPKMSDDFFNVLSERLVANNFSDERLKDAVNNLLDNFQYKELNISDIIKFDRKIKLYTYNEVCELVTNHKASFEDFEIREIKDNKFWIRKSEI